MDRTLTPVLSALLGALEPELDQLGFRLESETYHHAAFGSATLEYHRRGARLRLIWDGKDRRAWMNLAAQPTTAFPAPTTYVDVDAQRATVPQPFSQVLSTVEQASARARQLAEHLRSALTSVPKFTG